MKAEILKLRREKRQKPQNAEENLKQKQNKLQLRRWSIILFLFTFPEDYQVLLSWNLIQA